jgi:DNA replication protein DnaC
MNNMYEQIKDDLGYLQLGRATEVFATLAEEARDDDMTHIEFLSRLIAEQASATRNRRLTARLRYARFPFRKTIAEFDFEFHHPSTANSLTTLHRCGSWKPGARSCSSANQAAAKHISP